jgi:hypothetical protein
MEQEDEDPDSIELSWDHFPQEAVLRIMEILSQAFDRSKENNNTNQSSN